MTSKNRLFATLGALAVAAGSAIGTAPASAQAASPLSHVQHCVYSSHEIPKLTEFERLVGRNIDCAVVFNDAAPTWAEWADPWFTRSWAPERHRWSAWAASDPAHKLVITQSLIPSGMPSDWRRRGAAGEYDRHAVALARTLVNRGLGDSIIRLAAEANGDWNKDHIGWNSTDRNQWRLFWARTVRAMKSVPGANFTFDLTVNSAYRPVNMAEYYPGNDVVDIIGIDQYDSLPKAYWPTQTRWLNTANRPWAFRDVAAFAQRNGKPLSIPEYGLVDRNRAGAGDNPAYLQGLAADLAGRNVAYMGYFNKNVNGVLRLEQTPRSLATWRGLFGTPTGR